MGLGASLGAWIGAVLASQLVRWMGPYPLLLIAAGVLALCVVLSSYIHRRAARDHTREEAAAADKPL